MSAHTVHNLWKEKFNKCLELEFSDPEYFKVHHILVLTFMLQTGAYATSVHEDAVAMLKRYLATPNVPLDKEEVAVLNSKFSSDQRDGNLTTKETQNIINASKSILDVRTDTAEQYRSDVIAWGNALIKELDK